MSKAVRSIVCALLGKHCRVARARFRHVLYNMVNVGRSDVDLGNVESIIL